MITVTVHEKTYTAEDMANVLELIAEQLRQGYVSGYGPTWERQGEEEADPDMEE